jgi:hypothetical protein
MQMYAASAASSASRTVRLTAHLSIKHDPHDLTSGEELASAVSLSSVPSFVSFSFSSSSSSLACTPGRFEQFIFPSAW